MTLDKGLMQPLYLQLENLLRRQIENGDLRPGDRLPSEPDLAQKYGISRMTARRALDSLVAEGLLERHAGKGTFVARSKMPLAASPLSSFSKSMRVLGLSVSTQVLELKIMHPPPKIAADLHLLPDQTTVFVKRLRYVDGEPLVLHTSYMPAALFGDLLHEDLTSRPLSQVMEQVSGLKLVASQGYIEAAPARPDEAALLGIRKGDPVLLERGVIYEAGGLPVRASAGVYRGDRFRLFTSASSGAAVEVKMPQLGQTEREPAYQWLTLNFNLME